MLPTEIFIGTLASKHTRAVKTIHGPHLDKEGNHFTPDKQEIMSLKDAMDTRFPDDRHFTAYTLHGLENEGWPRLSKQALQSFEELVKVDMGILTFDWDCPNHAEWTPELYADFFAKLFELDGQLGNWRYCYTTLHGARVIYTLSTAVPVTAGEQYIATLFLMFKEAGLDVDPACKDWTRLFRCPRVLRDGKDSSKDPFFEIHEQDKDLDLSTIKKSPTKIIPTLKHFDATRAGQPAHDEIDKYLKVKSGTNYVQSDFYKDAKRELKKLRCYDALFKSDVPLASQGDRNDSIMSALGTVIPIIIRQVRYATPEHVYALFHGPVSAFEQDQDWFAHLWNAIISIWPVEIAKYNLTQEDKAKHATKALGTKEAILEGMRRWSNHPSLSKDDGSEMEFVDRHLIASLAPNNYFLMGKDGYLDTFPVSSPQIIMRVRTTFLDTIIPTRKPGQFGELQDLNSTEIINKHGTVIREAEYVPQLESNGYIEDMNGTNPTLKMPMYRRNPHLEPTYNADVDEWLCHFFGRHYEQGTNWLAYALAFEEGPICALSICAPPGIGKGMMIEGLSECLEKPLYATSKEMTSQYNGNLSRTPFLNVNEEWPTVKGISAQEKFKNTVSGDKLPSEEKYCKGVYISNPVRLILTANNHDIIRTLLDKDMSADDREAVGQRLMHFDLDGSAASWLAERGGNAFTGRTGSRWIARPGDPSQFIVAKHFLWLWKNRLKSDKGFVGRFLVEGNCARNAPFMTQQIVQKDTTATLISAIFNLIESASQRRNYKLDEKTHKVYVTVDALMDELKINDTPMNFGKAVQVLRNVAATQSTRIIDHKEYHELDCNMLLEFAAKLGKSTPNLRKIVQAQMQKSI
jgi:hypothetical protein